MCVCVSNEDNTKKKKLLVTFILVTSGFLLGYGPLAIFHTIMFFGKKQIDLLLFEKLNAVFLFPFEISLCLNLVLYAFRSSSVKEGFKRIFLPCSSQTMEQNAMHN